MPESVLHNPLMPLSAPTDNQPVTAVRRTSNDSPEKDFRAEKLHHATYCHWIRYVQPAAVCIILGAIGVVFAVLASMAVPEALLLAQFLYGVGTLLLLFAYHKFFHTFLSEKLRCILLTNKRVIYFDNHLFLAENEHEIPLRRITDVSIEKIGLMSNLLNYGTLCFDASPTGDTILRRSIRRVPKPHRLTALIGQLLPAASQV